MKDECGKLLGRGGAEILNRAYDNLSASVRGERDRQASELLLVLCDLIEAEEDAVRVLSKSFGTEFAERVVYGRGRHAKIHGSDSGLRREPVGGSLGHP